MRKSTFALPVVVIALVLLLSSIFIVDEREKALVLQFGRVVAVKEDPGLAFKIPLIQEVVRYDSRILSRDVEPLEVTPLDDRRLVVDAFARYRISDVTRFRQAVGAGGITIAESRLDSILRSQTREVLGSVSSNDILSSDRAALMLRIRNGAIAEARPSGNARRRTSAPAVRKPRSVSARRPTGPWSNWCRTHSVRPRSPEARPMPSGTVSLPRPSVATRTSSSSIAR